MEPRKFGRYEIKSELGRGGMATVYHAHDPRFRRDVALKVLPREFLHDTTFRARFEREAQTLASLEHSAIVPVYDFGEEDGQPFLVMRFLSDGNLIDRLNKGPLPLSQVVRIVSQVASGLDEAHGQGIIHRDLKPDNILFDQHQDAFITDFGIAKLAAESNSITMANAIIGTPAYMSPEQVNGEEVDGRSDIYALGVIVFEMLTGQLPYEASTPVGLLMKHITEPVPHILTLNPDLPLDCAAVVAQAMAKDRDERYATATDLSTALSAAIVQSKFSHDTIIASDEEVAKIGASTHVTTKSGSDVAPSVPAVESEPLTCPNCNAALPDDLVPNQQFECTQCGLALMMTESEPAQQGKKAGVESPSRMAEEAFRTLVETLLNDGDPQARSNSAKTLGRLCQEAEVKAPIRAGIVKILIKALADPEPEVRFRVAEALSKFSYEFAQLAIEPLTLLLEDADEKVRQQVQISLQKIDERHAQEVSAAPSFLRLGIGEYGREVEVSLDKTIHLGRSDPTSAIYPEVDLTDDDGLDRGVSRSHARILRRNGNVIVEDLGSANGTFINGQRLPPRVPKALQDNDQLHLGTLPIEVKIR